tara:strand:- start:57 stop:1514 length:1458 start_codon:yes stop_codon:yes gene_type:complete
MSTIKVDKITKRTGSTLTVGEACTAVKVEGDDVRSNAYKASDAGNIISQSGTTITLGASGDTITIACGASQTGFGRSGTVDWQTSSIKTSTFTAESGKGYFVNTTSGGITVNLPAGVAGAIVGLKDYANTWDDNAVTLNPNGSDNIGGGNTVDPTLAAEGGSVLLVFVDSTQGWLPTQQSVTASPTGSSAFITATGGTITTSGDYKIHTFTGSGCFALTAGTSAPNNKVSYMVVAGGGGAPYQQGGGGGAGGFREGKCSSDPYADSPLDSGTAITVTSQTYPIAVGAGGAGGTSGNSNTSAPGAVSTFSTITSTGGGNGAPSGPYPGGAPGGSGGGAGENQPNPGTNGNQPPVSPPQGNPGGSGNTGPGGGGGGGGAGAAGSGMSGTTGGAGGNGVATSITGSPVTRAGGGGGGGYPSAPGPGGAGGSGGGGPAGSIPSSYPPSGGTSGTAGTANTGGGGGSGSWPYTVGGAGGSGVVVLRYKFQ